MLYERDGEFGQVSAALESVLLGTGRALLVQGPPGIGKSRLLDALCARTGDAVRVLRARGGEQERDLPLGAVRELFEPVVRRAADADRDRLFAGAGGLVAPLLGAGGEPGATVDSAFAVMHGLYWFTANLADGGPLALVIDDAHWVDEATQRWLAYLLPRIEELPVLLAIALRPRELDPASRLASALASIAELITVEPRPLTLAGVSSVLRVVVDRPDPEFCAAVHRATGGNPLLVRTIAGAVKADGLAPTAANADRVETLGLGRVGQIFQPRLYRLGTDALELARAAAILGPGCLTADARELAGVADDASLTAVDALVGAGILQPERALEFTHPLVRAAVIDELPPGARADLNRRAAVVRQSRGSDPADVARHLVATDRISEPWALGVLRQAAALSSSRGAPEAAITFLERALREPCADDERAGMLLQVGLAALQARHPEALGWLLDALHTAKDPVLWLMAWMAAGPAHVLRGRDLPSGYFNAMPRLEGDLALAVSALLTANYGFFTETMSGPPAPPAELPAGTTPFQRIWLAAASFEAVMDCQSAARAVMLAERALASGEFLAEAGETWAYPLAIRGLLFGGAVTRGRECASDALDLAVRRGSLMAYEFHSTGRAMCAFVLGDLDAAEADILASLDADNEFGFVMGRPNKLATLVDVLRERGEYDRAEEKLAAFGYLDRPAPANPWGSRLMESRGLLHLARNRLDEAFADLRACGATLSGFGKRSSAMSGWRAGVAMCLAATGERAEAVSLAAEQATDARSFAAAPWLGYSLRVLGMLTGGDEGIDLLREAVTVLAVSEARLEHAHALCDLGVLLRRARHPIDAREPLRIALDLAQRFGAHLLSDRAAHELRAAGARPRRRMLTGADALTATERRVVQLATEGLSNPEIAQSLFVTRKTVEKHLGNAFLKLAVSSRSQLAQALAGGR